MARFRTLSFACWRSFFAPLLAAALLAGAAALPARADTIKLRTRAIDDVEVVEETATAVRYRIRGSLQEEPAENVVEVIYTRRPIGYDEAMAAFKRGEYARASEALKKLAEMRDAWVRQYAIFHLAEARRHLGDLAGAAEWYRKLLADFPNARFAPWARLGLGIVRLEQKDFAGAQKAFEDLVSEAKSKRYGDSIAEQASVRLAATLEAQGKLREALDRYDRLAAAARQRGQASLAEVAAFRLRAQLEPARADFCLAGLEGLVEAQLSKGAEGPVDSELLAAAYTSMGDICDAKGDAQKALLFYLRVVVDPDLSKVASERPHALWGAARAFEKAKTENWKERAEQLRRELRDQFPNSIWAKK